MRILFICQFFAPDITAAAFRMSDFARLLAEAGDEIRVITSYPHKAQVAEVDDTDFTERGIEVMRCHVTDVVGTGAKAYLRHYLSFVKGSLRLGVKLWRAGWRPDVIYVSSPPLFVGISGRILSSLFRRPVVFEVRDIWPDAAVSAGQLSAEGRAYGWGRRLERFLYRQANQITCVAKPMRDYLVQYARCPVTVVYNGILGRDVPELPDPSVFRQRTRRTLLYAGNLGHVQQLDVLVKAFAEIAHEPQLVSWDVHFLGTGAQLENLKQLTAERGIADRVHFLDPVTRDEAARQISEADMLYLQLMSDATMEKTIPSKLFDYLLAARPIVGGLAGEGREILQETGANVVFQPGNETDLKRGLFEAVEHWDDLDSRAGANRALVLSRFTREQAAAVLRNVFQSLVKSSS